MPDSVTSGATASAAHAAAEAQSSGTTVSVLGKKEHYAEQDRDDDFFPVNSYVLYNSSSLGNRWIKAFVEGVDYENNCYQLDVKRNAPKDRVRRPNKPPSHIPAPRANSAGRRLSFGGTAIGATTTTTNCAANKSVMLNDKETWEDEDFDQHELRSSERVFELIPKEPLQIPFAKYNAENTFTEQSQSVSASVSEDEQEQNEDSVSVRTASPPKEVNGATGCENKEEDEVIKFAGTAPVLMQKDQTDNDEKNGHSHQGQEQLHETEIDDDSISVRTASPDRVFPSPNQSVSVASLSVAVVPVLEVDHATVAGIGANFGSSSGGDGKNIRIREEEVEVMVDQKGDLIYCEKPEEDDDDQHDTHTAGPLDAPRLKNKSKNLLSPVEEEPSNAESLYESESSSSDIFAEKEDKYTIVIVTTPVLESGEHDHAALERMVGNGQVVVSNGMTEETSGFSCFGFLAKVVFCK
ncbi:unnamed protein product [Amoebophrya sp. A120]|nr:unnamed protein product [Amoebophrya sp. A120]|eukprot:GSA120T00013112001.1